MTDQAPTTDRGILLDIRERVIKIETQCGPCQTQLAEHEKIIRGDNGNGLTTRLALQENNLTELQTRCADNRKGNTAKLWALVGVFVVAILSMLGFLLTGDKSAFLPSPQ